MLWGFTLRRLEIAEAEIRRHIDVWGADGALPKATGAVTREQIERVLYDENGAYRRLRRVMDAWCALWYWPVTKRSVPDSDPDIEIVPPTWDAWLGGLEAILGVQPKETERDRRGQAAFTADLDWHGLDEAEDFDRGFTSTQLIDAAKRNFPWLHVAEQIAKEQGFFHWELDFAPVFADGGFDLQVGNPPWVRPFWDEAGALAEHDPWWQLTSKPAEQVKSERRERTLSLPGALNTYLDERAAQAGMNEHLADDVQRPVLRGLQPDLYRCFMERTWRHMSRHGIVGLIHPESHFTEARAGDLRRATYSRLRRHFHYRNELRLFEVDHHKFFGLHIYGSTHSAEFTQASFLYHPETIDRSYVHNGSGAAPGIRDTRGEWDLRPHAQRLVLVDKGVLSRWAALIDEPGTPAAMARMLYPINRASADVLDKIAEASGFGDFHFQWTAGWHESGDRRAGFFESRSAVPSTWADAILQGPHLTVGTPLFKEPNESMRSNLDYTELDLLTLAANFIPRTSYQRVRPYNDYINAYPKWQEQPSTDYFRLAWREMCDPGNVRTLHSALLPPGPTHVHAVHTLTFVDRHDSLVRLAGISHSIVADFLIKVIGSGHMKAGTWRRIPYVSNLHIDPSLLLRTLRLNCLVEPYAPLWEELFDREWQHDSWVPDVGLDRAINTDKPALSDVSPKWSWHTPLRRDADRRQALVEIDAIVAVMLDITADELVTIYRTQFPVLQKYEREALYDAHGRQVPRELAKEYRKHDGNLPAEALTVDGKTYALPFLTVDREGDYRAAHAHFSRLAREGAP